MEEKCSAEDFDKIARQRERERERGREREREGGREKEVSLNLELSDNHRYKFLSWQVSLGRRQAQEFITHCKQTSRPLVCELFFVVLALGLVLDWLDQHCESVDSK